MSTVLQSRFVRGIPRLLLIAAATVMLAGGTQCHKRATAEPGFYAKNTQAAAAPNRKLLVFVHGVMGGARATWTYSDRSGEVHWPALAADDPRLADFDVYVASYHTPALKKAKTLYELGVDLNFDLERSGVFEHYDSVVFVAHSMGNLVVRSAVLDGTRYRNLRVPLILSLAAPWNGSDLARLASLVSGNPQFRDMIKDSYNSWMQSTNEAWLRERPNTEIACAYETLDFPGLGGRIVERGDATSLCTRRPPKPIGGDHSSMVKPRNATTDEIYAWFLGELRRKPERVAPYRVVLMDSFALVYETQQHKQGEMNSHVIKAALKDLPFDVEIQPVHENWQDYASVVKFSPELVIIHFSSLYDTHNRNDPEGRLRAFLAEVLARTRTKVLVYSRWDEQYREPDGGVTGPMQAYLVKMLGADGPKYRNRVRAFDVNGFGVANPAFSNSRIARELRLAAQSALDMQ